MTENHLGGRVVKASALCVGGLGFESWPGQTKDLNICILAAPRLAPDIMGTVLGLVGSVSVYCD